MKNLTLTDTGALVAIKKLGFKVLRHYPIYHSDRIYLGAGEVGGAVPLAINNGKKFFYGNLTVICSSLEQENTSIVDILGRSLLEENYVHPDKYDWYVFEDVFLNNIELTFNSNIQYKMIGYIFDIE